MRIFVLLFLSFASSLALAQNVNVDAPAEFKYLCGPDKASDMYDLIFPKVAMQIRNPSVTKVVLTVTSGNCLNGRIVETTAQRMDKVYVSDMEYPNSDSIAMPGSIARLDRTTHQVVLVFNNDVIHSTTGRQFLVVLPVSDGEYQMYVIFDQNGQARVSMVP